jgi:hypothetical protein
VIRRIARRLANEAGASNDTDDVDPPPDLVAQVQAESATIWRRLGSRPGMFALEYRAPRDGGELPLLVLHWHRRRLPGSAQDDEHRRTDGHSLREDRPW